MEAIGALDSDGLRAQAFYIDRQLENLSRFEALNHDLNGKFLIEELKARRDVAKALYKNINPLHEHALLCLMQLQAQEKESDQLIKRIEDAKALIEQLCTQRKSLEEMVAHRNKDAERNPHYIPGALGKDQ